MNDLLAYLRHILSRLSGPRCHCGASADTQVFGGQQLCWPCKYAWHETCPCSDQATWGNAQEAGR